MAFCGCVADQQPRLEGCDALVVGWEGAGKTFLIKKLQSIVSDKAQEPHADTVATYGVELAEISVGKGAEFSSISIREVGGQMLPLWSQYYDDCRMVVYVIDAGDPTTLADTIVQLYTILAEPKLQQKPMCIVLGKYDLPITFKRVEVDMMSRLDDICKADPERITVIQLSAFNGRGITKLMDWMYKIKKGIVAQAKKVS